MAGRPPRHELPPVAQAALDVDVDMLIESLERNDSDVVDAYRCALGEAGLRALSKPLVANTSVHALKLGACMITRDSADVLVDAVVANGRIHTLVLAHNHLGAQGASHLQRLLSQGTSLTRLDLYNTMLGDSGVDRIATALADNSTLLSLDLRSGMTAAQSSTRQFQTLSRGIGSDDGEASVTSRDRLSRFDEAKSGAPETVDATSAGGSVLRNGFGAGSSGPLSPGSDANPVARLHSGLTPKLAQSPARAAAQASVTAETQLAVAAASKEYARALGRGPSRRFLLQTAPNPITAMGAAALYRCLRVNATLTELNVGYNCLGDAGTASIAKAIGGVFGCHCRLQVLSLAYNGMTAEGCESLAASIAANTTLTSLDISGNNVGCKAAAGVVRASLTSKALRTLKLTACGFVEDESETLCSLFASHPSIVDLTLDQNELGDIGALALSHALNTNTVLLSLSMVHCHICEGGARRVLYSLETKNRALRAIDMAGNDISEALHHSIDQVVKKRNASTACVLL